MGMSSSIQTHLKINGNGYFNPIALRMAKTLQSFGHSECNRVNLRQTFYVMSQALSGQLTCTRTGLVGGWWL